MSAFGTLGFFVLSWDILDVNLGIIAFLEWQHWALLLLLPQLMASFNGLKSPLGGHDPQFGNHSSTAMGRNLNK